MSGKLKITSRKNQTSQYGGYFIFAVLASKDYGFDNDVNKKLQLMKFKFANEQ